MFTYEFFIHLQWRNQLWQSWRKAMFGVCLSHSPYTSPGPSPGRGEEEGRFCGCVILLVGVCPWRPLLCGLPWIRMSRFSDTRVLCARWGVAITVWRRGPPPLGKGAGREGPASAWFTGAEGDSCLLDSRLSPDVGAGYCWGGSSRTRGPLLCQSS